MSTDVVVEMSVSCSNESNIFERNKVEESVECCGDSSRQYYLRDALVRSNTALCMETSLLLSKKQQVKARHLHMVFRVNKLIEKYQKERLLEARTANIPALFTTSVIHAKWTYYPNATMRIRAIFALTNV
ncbi:hypothetical protein KIN20_030125 [Parelaphostrongylus tenuis]|uniref:Uncharacterized protein n=1 Tax=Parelaphostrongylus tenuis TaxID=148309 RepID=A0AAD5R3G2_PARTN|nr:hypothetical protein KIN20_030125 [Parelaphostrongylus tenuis]